ncbi:MAG: succinyl-CoA synthetase beta subunit [Thermoleophilaceae bacterium]|jgi:succinyl-CoA synthetase beta subunit/citryl-CoA synthetase large subunit|nr:succinyl-CoA synthetase beta subunit [Thermoleophilaceae bacterium]
MRFFEYESRQILQREGIPVADGGFATDAEAAKAIAADIGGPVVIKSQVLTGGRMKAGGVKFADTPEEAEAHAREILALEINGHMPKGVLIGAKAEIKQEYYAGVIYDGIRKLPTFVFSDMGGIDIEEVAEQHPDHIGRGHFSTILPHMDFNAKDAIASIGITGSELNRLTPILSKLAQLFVKYDMTLAEINPLAQLADGTFVAVDAHMDMENEGRPRQKALLKDLGVGDEETREAREPTQFEIDGEKVDSVDHRGVAGNVTEFDGNLGLVIGAGGGSLTLFDAVRRYGGRPANYCEIGGNPSVSKAKNLTKLVLSKPGVDKIAVMMSIVSNTRVDIVARGVIKACLELGFDPAEKIAVFRIPGAWEEEGFKILDKYGVEYFDRTVSMHEAAKRAVEKIGAGAAA